ncbi:TonB-dependent receptor plug domain-containing protein [Burkholderia plantarii]|uniref:TonB-dependent receptor plug domain-containing protein n=1 Tax=Burkholderia plantarii TaxID=41899 RepID=UPI0018DEC0F1|nr:TonB-dependent receptor plug domain-containing protein [Burkholderia plantarii]MBI0328637.1 TonB-dependent receptor plug domain-containing protein [Burkholderia plantarii]
MAPNTATVMIRGMGSLGDRSGNPPVPMLVDGVPVSDSVGMQLFDLDGIDVLRGPHSLFGPNALGGMVMTTPRDPGKTCAANLTFDFGAGGRARALASADTPLSGRSALRIALGGEHADGYVDNLRPGRHDTAGWTNLSAHLKLLHRDEHGGEWRFSVHQLNSHGGSDMFAPSELARNHQSTAIDAGASHTTNTLLALGYERAFGGGTRLAGQLGASRSQHRDSADF